MVQNINNLTLYPVKLQEYHYTGLISAEKHCCSYYLRHNAQDRVIDFPPSKSFEILNSMDIQEIGWVIAQILFTNC